MPRKVVQRPVKLLVKGEFDGPHDTDRRRVVKAEDITMAAAPVVMLANGITISRVAPHASRRVEGQWGGAGGASIEEEHAARWPAYVSKINMTKRRLFASMLLDASPCAPPAFSRAC